MVEMKLGDKAIPITPNTKILIKKKSPIRVGVKTDGTIGGTKIFDVSTGDEILGVTDIRFGISVGKDPWMTLTVFPAYVEIEGEPEFTFRSDIGIVLKDKGNGKDLHYVVLPEVDDGAGQH